MGFAPPGGAAGVAGAGIGVDIGGGKPVNGGGWNGAGAGTDED